VPAELRARDSASLAPRAPAAVTELPFREGQRVTRGAVVARLDDRGLRAAERAAEAAFAGAEADARRIEALHSREAATPQELEQATSRAAAARAGLEAAREARAYAVLVAPFAGRVARRPVDVGDVVAPGTPVVVVEGDALELVASVDSLLVARLAPGQEWDAQVDGWPEPVRVRIRSVAPSGDAGTHRFEVRADVPPLDGLRAGVFARLLLEGGGGESRLLVAASAVFERGGLVGVYVVEAGRARLRWIAAGRRMGDDVEVRAGLTEGEQVAETPAGLSDGRAIQEQS
jgi:RND family efflux transporter MFP subunit